MTTNDYVPIGCDQHSILELLAMHRSRVRVDALDESGAPISLDGRVADVITRAGAEYLVLDAGAAGMRSMRLDRVIAIFDASSRVFPCR